MIETDLRAYIDHWRRLNAWWEHSGDPTDPHVILSEGDHSTLFMNNGVIAHRRPVLFQQMLLDMVQGDPRLQSGFEPDFVVAPAMGGVQPVYGFALAIAKVWDVQVEQYYTTKAKNADGKVVDMTFERGTPPSGAKGIAFDDVATTANAIKLCTKATLRWGAEIVSAQVILNRSPSEFIKGPLGEDIPLHALVRKEVKNSPPDQCELCRLGSKAFRPKELWDELIKT